MSLFLLGVESLEEAEFSQVRLSALLTDLCTGYVAKEGKRIVFRDTYKNTGLDAAPVTILRLGHFNNETDELDWKAIADDIVESSEDLPEIQMERRLVIEPDDLLLSFRGRNRVIRIHANGLNAMPKEIAEKGYRLVPSNNFILIRPQKQLIDVSYLHMYIKLILTDGWGYQEKNQKEINITNQSVPWSLDLPPSVRFLRELLIRYPMAIEVQESLVKEYQEINKKEMELMAEKQKFCRNLFNLTN